MNQYVTGTMIRRLREGKKMTQLQLAEKLSVSDKAISKWETGRGYPDISLIEALADALDVSVIELFSGEDVRNTNKSSDMLRTNIYVCPVCGNVIWSIGDTVVSCCGIVLPVSETEQQSGSHLLSIERSEDEYYVTVRHDMTKTHYISFIIAVKDDGFEFRKLYPEENAEARFKVAKTKSFLFYCNRHGLFRASI